MQIQAFTNTKIKFWLIIKIISEVILFLKFWLESCAQVMVKEQDVYIQKSCFVRVECFIKYKTGIAVLLRLCISTTVYLI